MPMLNGKKINRLLRSHPERLLLLFVHGLWRVSHHSDSDSITEQKAKHLFFAYTLDRQNTSLRKGRPISYSKFQHDTPNGLACSSEKLMGGCINPPPLHWRGLKQKMVCSQMKFNFFEVSLIKKYVYTLVFLNVFVYFEQHDNLFLRSNCF